MAIYTIGDVQGCFDPLRRLLDKLAFDPAHDQLWFTGDLVNRGPHSLDTLRFVKQLADAAVAVLGNHDLHLLAIATCKRKPHRKDTLHEILAAPDTEELLDWLRRRPLLHQQQVCSGGGVMRRLNLIHAGLPPQWDAATAKALAGEVEAVLRGNHYPEFFEHMYGDRPDLWSADLTGWRRLRFITNCLTRMRYCDAEGRLDLTCKLGPSASPTYLLPWFAVPGRRSLGEHIVFGHWSTLGFYADQGCYCLDTGCLWGGELTALRLDGDWQRISVGCGA
ncbi:MAG: symmetrical bis(5'-nucleosyl)-tetraphosphatase [Methylococcaceae bacterium]|nr:MAG: symmetrical bis(5'-nucleosyl)-tetraphosphatase [Methylococcaceae bacterium]